MAIFKVDSKKDFIAISTAVDVIITAIDHILLTISI